MRVFQYNCSSAHRVTAIGLRKFKSRLGCIRSGREENKESEHENGKGKESSFVDHCFLYANGDECVPF